MIKCDVLVVGGGPAGLTAAYFLSKKGLSTIVIDKQKSLGRINSEYDITEGSRIKHILDKIKIKPNKISNKSEWFSQNNSFLLESKIEDYYFKRGPDKDSIENILKQKILKNIEILTNSNIKSIHKKKDKILSVLIEGLEEEIRPNYVIAADGTNSYIRTKMKMKSKKLVKIKGLGILAKTKDSNTFPHAKIYFDYKIAPGGYTYLGSVGKEIFFCVVIDSLFSDKISLKSSLDKFRYKYVKNNMDIINYFEGAGISGIQPTIVGNVIFVGAAAMLHDPFFGYGLNYSLESSYYATDSIINNNLDVYREYTKKLHQNLNYIYEARKILRKADNDFFDKLIQAFNGNIDEKDERLLKILETFGE